MSVLSWSGGRAQGSDDSDESRVFAYALAGALVLQAALVATVAFWPYRKPQTVLPSSIAVEMVTLPRPAPSAPKPRPRPVVPVVHKVEPKPLVTKERAREVVPPRVRSKVAPRSMPITKPRKTVPAASPSPQMIASLMSRYVGLVRPMIEGHLRVPALLKAMGMSGHSTIEFRLSPRGRLLWAKVLVPSRIRAVNAAALAAVEGSHYPQFLRHMPRRDTTFEITVHISGDGS
ncbi:TonB family protein [Acidiferrobacter sp.]|uniref:TonB family protein n=1 Tax=Acidiferrobacter sp. TaxID=1872107 RepID=UPI00262ED99F|nr:TonB family protein [Acidiferrobacter sp.]